MLKVAHIVSSLNVGGAERFVIDLCSVQAKMNIASTIISLGQQDDPLTAECRDLDIPVISFSCHIALKVLKISLALRKFDVVHIHSPSVLKFLRFTLPLLKVKFIYTRHGAAHLKSDNWKLIHKRVKPYIHALTFVSREGQENFSSVHDWQDTKQCVIDNGVHLVPATPTLQERKVLRIGSVGRMIPLKHQIGLLKAVRLLSVNMRNNIELHFFGDGELLQELQAYQQKHLADVSVHFHGMVSDREFIYSSFDVLVVTSQTEGLSMVIIEAMARKIPAIATTVGGNPKLVIDNETGFLFAYDDSQHLAELITYSYQNQKVLANLGEASYQHVKANFSIESTAKKYAELYNIC